MRVALYSSKKPRCGIATYADHLEDAFRRLGVDVRHWGSLVNDAAVFSEIRSWWPDVLHVQYEQTIMPPDDSLLGHVAQGGARKNVLTLHSETHGSVRLGSRGRFHAVVVHRPPEILEEARVLPMPCPLRDPPVPGERESLRRRYGFDEGAFVLSTVGFLMPWKKTEEIAGHLARWMAVRPDVTLQVIASRHFNPDCFAYAEACSRELLRLSGKVKGRIRHVSGYPSDDEVVDRLRLSDLGYVYCPFDTASSSAAASLFTSARCPLVTSASTHYDHLIGHCVRAPGNEPERFVRTVVESAQDGALLIRLRQAAETLYADTNYIEFARRHLRIYGF